MVRSSHYTHGDEHQITTDVRLRLAEHYIEQEFAIDTAITLIKQSLDRNLRVLGDRHLDTTSAKYMLADCYLKAGRVEAVDLLDQVLQERQLLYGDNDVETLNTAHDLASALVRIFSM